MTEVQNDFDAAKAIYEQLKDIPKERQQKILRWIAETFDLALHTRGTSPREAPHAPEPDSTPSVPEPEPPTVERRASVDIKTFVAEKQPKSDMQFAAVVSYYYQFVAPEQSRKDTVDSATLIDAARLANWKRPPRPGMTLTNAKNQGYLDSVGKGGFRLNSVGENLVAMTLPGEASLTRSPPRKAVSKAKKSGK